MDKKQLIGILSHFGDAEAIATVIHDSLPLREPLPDKRETRRAKITVGNHCIYVDVGFYPDGRPGEVFFQASKYGTELRDMFTGLGTVLSIALQHGVPLSAFPLRGRGSDLTGEGNELLDAIFTAVEELCSQDMPSEK